MLNRHPLASSLITGANVASTLQTLLTQCRPSSLTQIIAMEGVLSSQSSPDEIPKLLAMTRRIPDQDTDR